MRQSENKKACEKTTEWSTSFQGLGELLSHNVPVIEFTNTISSVTIMQSLVPAITA